MIKRRAIVQGRAHNIHTRTSPSTGIAIAEAAEEQHRTLFGPREHDTSVIGKAAQYELYKVSPKRKQWMQDHPKDYTFFYSVDSNLVASFEDALTNEEAVRRLTPFREGIESIRI